MSAIRGLTTSVLLCLSLLACSDKEGGGGAGNGPDTGAGSGGSADADGDGYDASVDCDDSNAAINPDAVEICDGLDNNCDDLIDDADPAVNLTNSSSWYLDVDGDGFGDDASAVDACDAPADHVADGGDCDDDDAAINPDATEVCDDMGVDEDCSGAANSDDPGVDPSTTQTYFPDRDGDGYGDLEFAGSALCEDPSTVTEAWLTDNSDCDDGDGTINPAATEVCDELDVDEDCSGSADNADSGVDPASQALFYSDGDGDGYGDELDAGTLYCDAFVGVVADNSDCDDGDGAIHPGATEVCDELDVDEDCSGTADDADAGIDTASQTLFYADTDSDGYGSEADSGTLYCDAPSGMVADNSDCDDGDADISPAATEICDGIDNDCDSGLTEAGMATFEDASGTLTDYTATLTGSSGSPAVVSLTTPGSLAVCEGTWYVNLDVSADVDIYNPSGAASDVVLDGAATASVITVATDGVAVHLEGLSIENGFGSGDSQIDTDGVSGGGIDCTADESSISAMSVDLQDNTAFGVGGAIGSEGCDLTLEDMVIANNTAAYGGGLYIDSAALSLTNSVVSDNAVTVYGGGMMAYDSAARATVKLVESDIRDNTADGIGGGALFIGGGDGISIDCAGSSGSSSGFRGNAVTTGNAGYGGGLALYGSDVVFESDTCDFGTSSGGDDNSPEDVSNLFDESYDFDDDETFTCVAGFCGVDTTYSLGGSSSTNSGPQYVSGNIILADTAAAIRSFSMKLATTSSSCTADFYVLYNSAETVTGWTVMYANLGVSLSSSAAYIDSGAINIASVSGGYYALLAGSSCSSGDLTLGYTYLSVGGTDAGFGTVLGYTVINNYFSSYAIGDSVDIDFFGEILAVDQEVTVLGE